VIAMTAHAAAASVRTRRLRPAILGLPVGC
jgi:hypothetical protein